MYFIKSRTREFVLIIVIIVIGVVTTQINPNFLTTINIANILNIASTMGIMAVGMTLIITTGNIDVSIGSVFYAVCVTCSTLCTFWQGENTVAIVLISVAVGLGIGVANGLLVALINMPAIVVTLATMSIVRGVVLIATDGVMLSNFVGPFTKIAAVRVGPLPITPVIWIVISILFAILIYKIRFGREILALGGNPLAAERIGIDRRRLFIIVFAIAGALTGLAGAYYASKIGVIHAQAGAGYEMKIIAAVVIGGTSFKGGKISLLGTFCGVLLMGVMDNMLTLMQVPIYWQGVTTGALLLAAVVSSAFTTDVTGTKEKYKTKVKKHDG